MTPPGVQVPCWLLPTAATDAVGDRLYSALAVLCDGPIALRPLAEALGCPLAWLEMDLEALIQARLVTRAAWTTRPLKWIYTLSPLGEVWRREWRAGPG